MYQPKWCSHWLNGLWFPFLPNQSAEMLPRSSLVGNLLLQSQDLRVTFFNFDRGNRLLDPVQRFFGGEMFLWRFSWKYLAMLKLWMWLNLYVPTYIPYTSKDPGFWGRGQTAKRPYKNEVVQPPQNIGSLEIVRSRIGTNHANNLLEGWF